jgi:hypothetical protein
MKHNLFKSLTCAFFLSFWSYMFSKDFTLLLINFCVLFLGIFFLTSMYDLIKRKIENLNKNSEKKVI